MKKYIAMLLALCAAASMTACGAKKADQTTAPAAETVASVEETVGETAEEITVATDPDTAQGDVMSYADFLAAEYDTVVTVETYIQAAETWENDQLTLHCQSMDGGYYIYRMEVSQENAAQLVPGTRIRVIGFKHDMDGQTGILDASYEILSGSLNIAALDATNKLGTPELYLLQNQLAAFKGVTVDSVEREENGYMTVVLSKDGTACSFRISPALLGEDSDTAITAGGLLPGDTVDAEAFVMYDGSGSLLTDIVRK